MNLIAKYLLFFVAIALWVGLFGWMEVAAELMKIGYDQPSPTESIVELRAVLFSKFLPQAFVKYGLLTIGLTTLVIVICENLTSGRPVRSAKSDLK